MKPRKRPPTHPGVILRKLINETEGLSQKTLARELGVSFQTVNMLVNARRSVSADIALRLAKRFDMSPQFWLNLQNAVGLHRAQEAMEARASG